MRLNSKLYFRWLLVFILATTLAACGGRKSKQTGVDASRSSVERTVGLLQYSDPKLCQNKDGCGPEFSLINDDFSAITAIYGKLNSSHHNLVVLVEGKQVNIKKSDARYLADMSNGAIKMKRYRILTTRPYYPFLPDAAAKYTTKKYGCELLWDKTYSWRDSKNQTLLLVRMTNTFSPQAEKPYMELAFDGSTGKFVEERANPAGVNPCRL